MIERMKKINRALLELVLGILICGVLCQVVGMLLTKEVFKYTLGLWFGVALAVVASLHMYRSLDRALDMGKDAGKVMVSSSLIRFFLLFLVMGIIEWAKAWNPLVTFLGYMTMKVAAYIQPFTHKVCNKIFREEDPIPEALPEEE